MEDTLIKYETAKLAKEKGFNEICKIKYNNSGNFSSIRKAFKNTDIDLTYSAPTQSLLQKWLREKHGIHLVIIPTITSAWTFKSVKVISEIDNDVILGLKSVSDLPPYKEVSGYDYNTYEEALEVGLVHGLKQIQL